MTSHLSLRRLKALCKKETMEILRDPSSNLIAFVLPVVMLLIFGYGLNLDSTAIRIGLVLEDASPEGRRFVQSLEGSPYLTVIHAPNQAAAAADMVAGRTRGFVVVPVDFAEKLKRPSATAPVQVVADGAEPNTASFVQNYVVGAWQTWLLQRAEERGQRPPAQATLEPRYWFNPSSASRNFLIPGSITVIMTVIGALLTSLVVAREWERGTMEALLATPITRTELLLSKLLPYYVLGIVSLFLCVLVAVFGLGIPFRGSLLSLWGIGTLFLGSSLGLGLLLSTLLRNQFNAAQAALNAAFLPAMMLSGFLYEIRSMPAPIRAVTYLIPARYFVTSMQTLFQAGDVPSILLRDSLFLAAAATLFIGLTRWKTRRRLE